MLEGRHKVTHPSYTDIEQLDYEILLNDIHYINPNSILICFPMKTKKKTNSDIDEDLVTVNNFFSHFVKEISVKSMVAIKN